MAAFGALSQYYRDHGPEEALAANGKAPWVLFRTYVTDQTRRVDELFSPSPEFLLDFAWTTMEMTVGMIPQKRREAVATAMLELWTDRPEGAYYGHKGVQSYLADKRGHGRGRRPDDGSNQSLPASADGRAPQNALRDCARYAGEHTLEQIQDIVRTVQSLKEAPSLAHLLSALAPDQPNATRHP